MMSSKRKVLSLYKSLLRECKKYNAYNYRMYSIEKTKYEFHANKAVSDPAVISQLLKKAQDNLEVMKRQVLVGHMYGEGHLVIEHAPYTKKT